MLYCDECGCCSGEFGKGWVAYPCIDPDEIDEPRIAVFCRPCVAAEFGYRPDVAARIRVRLGTTPQATCLKTATDPT